jgi:hypothetical protein
MIIITKLSTKIFSASTPHQPYQCEDDAENIIVDNLSSKSSSKHHQHHHILIIIIN